MAFNVVFLTCLVSVNHELIQILRYLMIFNGVRVLISPSTFMGMVIEGPGPSWWPLLDFVKCISSHFTWSILSPLSFSHLRTDSKATCTIRVASSLDKAIADLAPSS